MKNSKHIFSVIAAAALVAACGGGGSGSSAVSTGSSQTPVATTPVLVTPVDPGFSSLYQALQTTVPASGYTGRDLEEFTTINEQRSKCGFGLLAANQSLTLAARDHTAYVNTNKGFTGLTHFQDAKFPNGFTGVTPTDRAKFRGYLGQVSEGAVGSFEADKSSSRRLLASPYHSMDMLLGWTEIGVSTGGVVVFDYGRLGRLQRASEGVLTYPCNGVTGTETQLQSETPSPYSPRNLATNPIGQAVYFFEANSATFRKTIEINNLAVTEAVSGLIVEMLPIQTTDNDANFGSQYRAAFSAPNRPLKNLTAYRVKATVVSNGKETLVDYTFTTK